MNYFYQICDAIIISNIDIITPCLFSFITGYISHDILSYIMMVGSDGVNYYAEAHVSPLNAWIHTIVMPYSIHGILLCIPALFNLTPVDARLLMWNLYYLFGGIYFRIDTIGMFLYFGMYFYPVKKSILVYHEDYLCIEPNDDELYNYFLFSKIQIFLLSKGLLISFYGLLFQEIVGHWLGGDIPSRPEAILNAIIYAMYFSSVHFYHVSRD